MDGEEEVKKPLQTDLLAFADTVGSARYVLQKCCGLYPCAELTVRVGGSEPLALQLDGRFYYIDEVEATLEYGTLNTSTVVRANTTREQYDDEVRAQAAAQLERLLFLALKLDLLDLRAQLDPVIVSNTLHFSHLLGDHPAAAALFSTRVCEAVPQQELRDAWVEKAQRAPCIIDAGPDALLRPVDLDDVPTISFRAILGTPAGSTMDVEIDLARGSVRTVIADDLRSGLTRSSPSALYG